MAKDVQKHVEKTTTDSEFKNIFELANLMNTISDGEKPQELPLMLKLHSESETIPAAPKTNGVDFMWVKIRILLPILFYRCHYSQQT